MESASLTGLWPVVCTAPASHDHGGAIDSGDNHGAGPVTAAANVFAGACDQAGGTWDDAGYMPQPGSAVTGIIPGNTTVSLPSGSQWVYPVTDQRGYYTSPPGSMVIFPVKATLPVAG